MTNDEDFNRIWHSWRGLGAWNFYFLMKFTLAWYGYLSLHPFANLALLCALLCPMPSSLVHKCRSIIAIPFGLALFYKESTLASVYDFVIQQSTTSVFNTGYAMQLLSNLINWNMVGALFALSLAYLYLSQWIRFTALSIIIIVGLNLEHYFEPAFFIMQQKINNSQKMMH